MDVQIDAALACRSKTEYRAAVARDLQPEYRAQTCAKHASQIDEPLSWLEPRAAPGIEPETSRTLSENHTPRPMIHT